MMRKLLLLAITSVLIFGAKTTFAQNDKKELNCFERYEAAFKERGSYTISDNIYRNVMISFFEGNEVYCVRGKVRVENGYVSAIFYYYDDNTEERSEEHTSELQSRPHLVCRLLLEKKNI